MALTDVGLAARALVRIGGMPITSFSDGSADSDIAGALYSGIRDALLSAHPWHFALGQLALTRHQDSPSADFSYAFALPSDFLRAISVGSGGRGRGTPYRIARGVLQTNAPHVTLTYIFRPAEEEFPPWFDQALIARLAAEFTIPLTENTSRAEALFRLAERELTTARQIDSQQDTPARIERFPLIDSRF